ncbi:MAG TPA: alpha-glucan family phosphorylase [Candidatus Binataceae bacterium]|nr:alpha-glucan family phosphorylase [Candidatus Binataceae bacterium]
MSASPEGNAPCEPGADQDLRAQLLEVALDLRFAWDHSTDDIWRRIDAELFDLTRNAWLAINAISDRKLQELSADIAFRRRVEKIAQTHREYVGSPGWFARTHEASELGCIAYFSMEFALSEALPIYSGGLGNVAGDLLKTASDLGIPLIGIGLLYQQGYFRQSIDADGNQQALYPYNAPDQLPIVPARDRNGDPVRIEFAFPGYKVWVRAWEAQVGRIKLYLLDTNDPANLPYFRGITGELYGGGLETRLMQELVLGIGGWRLIRQLGLKPDVCHLNEGHAAFAVLERTACFMEDTGKSFEVALAATRAANLFTTHTPVAAGFDRFEPALISRFLERFVARRMPGVSLEQVLRLGRKNPDDRSEPFNMAYLAIRGSGAINAVSRLHGAVSRSIFQELFPRWPVEEVPIGYVTNGVHTPTWDSAYSDRVWTEAYGRNRWTETMEGLGQSICACKDDLLWGMRADNRAALVGFIRERFARQQAADGHGQAEIDRAHNVFDPNTLTIGFARRFATYKRPNLLLHDPDRLARILNDQHTPVQLVIAGKAHPADQAGIAMVKQWIQFVKRPDVQGHVVFLSDYDLLLAEKMVQGVDVWINTPRRPWEACGTSGMKVLVNGGLNLSELDGWWAEAYSPEVGWALGDGKEHDTDPAWDALEAEALYGLLEREVIPKFYARDERGIPAAWVAMMRASMSRLTPEFSSNRAVREYLERYYLPSAATWRKRSANGGAAAAEIVAWRERVMRHWPALHFGAVAVETTGGEHLFSVQVYLDELETNDVVVELYADGDNVGSSVRVRMERGAPLVGAINGFVFGARVPAERPAADYTPRIVPNFEGATAPLEANQILWQR